MTKKIIVILISLTLITGCGCSKKENKKNEEQLDVKDTNEEITKDREVDGLKLTNTSLTCIEKHWTLVTKVTNNTGSDYELNEFKIIIKDKDGNIITTLSGYVGGVIPNGSTREINSGTYVDLTNAKKIEYEVIK